MASAFLMLGTASSGCSGPGRGEAVPREALQVELGILNGMAETAYLSGHITATSNLVLQRGAERGTCAGQRPGGQREAWSGDLNQWPHAGAWEVGPNQTLEETCELDAGPPGEILLSFDRYEGPADDERSRKVTGTWATFRLADRDAVSVSVWICPDGGLGVGAMQSQRILTRAGNPPTCFEA